MCFFDFHFAALIGHAAVVNTLLHGWADILQSNNDGWTALHMAAIRGHAAVVNILLSRVPETDRVALINQINNNGFTALHMAAR